MNTKSKRILLILAITLVLACVFTIGAFAADGAVCITDSNAKGITFDGSERLHPGKAIDEMPRTYEAVIKLPAGTSGESTVFGNYLNLSTPHINFLIKRTGQPAIYMHDIATKDQRQSKIVFNTDVTGDAWVHVVITHESKSGGDIFSCYINGEFVESTTAGFEYGEIDMSYLQNVSSFHLGEDFRAVSKDAYFKGEIKDFALYSEPLTAEEIKANYNRGISTENDSLILYYNLAGKDGTTEVADSSDNGYTLKPMYFEEENEPTDYDFSFAVIGDTQKLVNYDTQPQNTTEYAKAIFEWIKANAGDKNIARVFGVGDITETPENDDETVNEEQEALEWAYASELYDMLTDSGIPYTVTWGLGHDRPAQFDKYFAGKENFTNSAVGSYTEMGCYTEGSIRNYYQRFMVEGINYLVLSLEYKNVTDSLFTWADNVIKANPNDKVIILTHYFLELDAGIPEANQAMWDRLVTNNKNVILTLSGHVNYPENIVRAQRVGNAGHTVTQLLINPQYMDAEYGYDQTSLVAMLYFSEGGSKVDVRYVSTIKSNANTEGNDILFGAINQFSFEIPEPKDIVTEYGTIPADYADAEKYPFIIFDGKGNFYQAVEYFAGDITKSEKNANYSVLHYAKELMKTNNWNGKEYGSDSISAVILMRRDYTLQRNESTGYSEAYTNISQFKGEVTIDLGGHILSANETAEKAIFNGTLKAWEEKYSGVASGVFDSEITVKNGEIVIYNTSLVGFSVTNAPGKNLTYNFEDIDLKVKGKAVIVANSNSTTVAKARANFINCSFDFTEAGTLSTSINLFHLGDAGTNTEITVRGGEMIMGSKVFTIATGGSAGTGSLSFLESDSGEFTTISASTATTGITSGKYNGGSLYFKKKSTSGDIATYAPVMKASYGDITYEIPYEYLSVNKYPFIVIDDTGAFVKGAEYFASDITRSSKASDYSALNYAKSHMKTKNASLWNGSGYNEGTVSSIIIMRRDYTLQNNSERSEEFANNSQFMGEVIIDLGGFTLAANPNNEKAIFNGTLKIWREADSGIAGGVFDSELTVKNGNILIYTKSLVGFGINDGAAGKKLTYNFENIDLKVKGSAVVVANSTSNKAQKGYASANFTDCSFDFSEAGTLSTSVNLFHLGDAYTNSKITVTGGEIIMGAKKFSLATGGTGEGSLTFLKDESDKYATLATSNSFTGAAATVNGGKLVFKADSTDGTTTTYILVPTASLGLDFTPKASVTLDSTLIFNIYLPTHAGLGTVTLDGEAVDLGEAKNGYYVISTPLMASESAEELKLVVNLTVNGTALKGSFTFSTVKYAQKLLATAGISSAEQTLAKDMLAYINSAYVFFNGSAVAEITALLDGYTSKTTINKDNAKQTVPGLSGATFTLEAKPTVQFFFADGFKYADFTFKVGNRTLTIEDVEEENDEYVKFALFAYEMTETFSYTVNAQSGEYNLIAYYAYASGTGVNDYKEDDKEKLTDLAAKFYNYCLSAKAYRQYVIDNQ